MWDPGKKTLWASDHVILLHLFSLLYNTEQLFITKQGVDISHSPLHHIYHNEFIVL